MRRTLLAATACIGLGTLAASPAQAVLVLSVDTSSQPTITVTDQGFGDLNPLVGAISTAEFLIGGLTFAITTATGSAIDGGPALPTIRIDSNGNTTASPPADITVRVTETNLTTVGPASYLLAANAIFPLVDTAPMANAVYTYYLDNGNAQFGTTTLLGTLNLASAPGSPAQSANQTVIGNPDGSYSLTNQIVLTGVDASTSFQIGAGITTSIPEPASLLLLGTGLLGLGMTMRRKRA